MHVNTDKPHGILLKKKLIKSKEAVPKTEVLEQPQLFG
jgi:hypothetical protein